jgi:hypothetical protein
MAKTNASTIEEYNNLQSEVNKKICEVLRKEIDAELTEAESKLWHGGPVWFLDENPIVGYWVRKNGVQLLFWSGQSFEEVASQARNDLGGLEKEGTFKAAQKVYFDVSEIDLEELNKWLKKSREIQWDYKNIVKNKGKLDRIK